MPMMELEHQGFFKEIAMKLLVVFLNVYDLVKENMGFLETMVVTVEDIVVFAVRPVYEGLKDLTELILVLVKDKFDKYAPNLANNIVAKINFIINKTIRFVQKHIKSEPIVETQPLIETSLPTGAKPPLHGNNTDAINPLDESSSITDKIQNFFENPNQTLDGFKSEVKSFMGTHLKDTFLNTISSLFKDNQPLHDVVNSVAQNLITQLETEGPEAALESAYSLLKLVPIAHLWYKANTYPFFHTLAKLILPVIGYSSQRYNNFITYMNGRGYRLFAYFPLVPIDMMKEVYKFVKNTMDGLSIVLVHNSDNN